MKKLLPIAVLVLALATFGGVAAQAANAVTADGPGSFLCSSTVSVNPVAYPDAVADQMWTTGNYFEPQAILGNVPQGVNIGAYHLVCDAATLPVQQIGSATAPVTGLDSAGQTIYFVDGQWWYPWDEPAVPAIGAMTMTALGLGGSGEVYDATAMAAYHADHPVNGNDLNVYHIWK